MERKALVEKLFNELDIKKEGRVKLEDLDKILLNVNEANGKILKKYLSKYQINSKAKFINKSSFTRLLMKKKNNVHVVHIKLAELLDNKKSSRSREVFLDRFKHRLSLPKYSKAGKTLNNNINLSKAPSNNRYESPEKKLSTISKLRNIKELTSVHRYYLSYSLLD